MTIQHRTVDIEASAKLWKDGLSASQIASRFGVSRNVIVGLAYRNRDRFPPRQKRKPAPRSEPRRRPREQAPELKAEPEIPATARIYVGVGKKDGATVSDLVAVLTKEVRVDRGMIGRVELRDGYSLVELPAQEAEGIARALTGATIRRKRVTARVDRGPAKPARTQRPPQRRG